MTAKTYSDSTRRVSRIIFAGIQDSFTTQAPARHIWGLRLALPHRRVNRRPRRDGNPGPGRRVRLLSGSDQMPYALFCNEAKLSKAYPTEAEVWKQARRSGLVVDVMSEEEKPAPRPVLDNDYEIRP